MQDFQFKGVIFIKGYYVSCGYMGWIDGKYRLFSTEKEYEEIYKEGENQL